MAVEGGAVLVVAGGDVSVGAAGFGGEAGPIENEGHCVVDVRRHGFVINLPGKATASIPVEEVEAEKDKASDRDGGGKASGELS